MPTAATPNPIRWYHRVLGIGQVLLGVYPRRSRSLKSAPRYLADREAFVKAGGEIAHRHAILDDYAEQAGTATGHYFHQDLLVAGFVHAAAPARHVDVGSRVDGFVAHVAAFRTIDVVDIRPLVIAAHPNIRYLQADLMQLAPEMRGISDSISCLHALEHFGLGRYGDPIDPQGHRKGFANLVAMLQPGGRLYLSFPIGAPAVHFNAHRVFAPTDPLAWAPEALELLRFDYVDDAGDLHLQQQPQSMPVPTYGCGIYSFRKRAEA